jgi:hypothetical protein
LISESLIKELNVRFPEQTPDPAWDDREIWIRVGQRKVVKFLNEQFARQNENILNREES